MKSERYCRSCLSKAADHSGQEEQEHACCSAMAARGMVQDMPPFGLPCVFRTSCASARHLTSFPNQPSCPVLAFQDLQPTIGQRVLPGRARVHVRNLFRAASHLPQVEADRLLWALVNLSGILFGLQKDGCIKPTTREGVPGNPSMPSITPISPLSTTLSLEVMPFSLP